MFYFSESDGNECSSDASENMGFYDPERVPSFEAQKSSSSSTLMDRPPVNTLEDGDAGTSYVADTSDDQSQVFPFSKTTKVAGISVQKTHSTSNGKQKWDKKTCLQVLL